MRCVGAQVQLTCPAELPLRDIGNTSRNLQIMEIPGWLRWALTDETGLEWAFEQIQARTYL